MIRAILLSNNKIFGQLNRISDQINHTSILSYDRLIDDLISRGLFRLSDIVHPITIRYSDESNVPIIIYFLYKSPLINLIPILLSFIKLYIGTWFDSDCQIIWSINILTSSILVKLVIYWKYTNYLYIPWSIYQINRFQKKI